MLLKANFKLNYGKEKSNSKLRDNNILVEILTI